MILVNWSIRWQHWKTELKPQMRSWQAIMNYMWVSSPSTSEWWRFAWNGIFSLDLLHKGVADSNVIIFLLCISLQFEMWIQSWYLLELTETSTLLEERVAALESSQTSQVKSPSEPKGGLTDGAQRNQWTPSVQSYMCLLPDLKQEIPSKFRLNG